MIKFVVYLSEIKRLKDSIPGFDVILKALEDHSEIDLKVEDDGWGDCFKTPL